MNKMCTSLLKKTTFIVLKICMGPTYKKPKSRKSAFIKNSSFEINRDPWYLVGEVSPGKVPSFRNLKSVETKFALSALVLQQAIT